MKKLYLFLIILGIIIIIGIPIFLLSYILFVEPPVIERQFLSDELCGNCESKSDCEDFCIENCEERNLIMISYNSKIKEDIIYCDCICETKET